MISDLNSPERLRKNSLRPIGADLVDDVVILSVTPQRINSVCLAVGKTGFKKLCALLGALQEQPLRLVQLSLTFWCVAEFGWLI
jgi:hypothetical protein